MSTRLPSTLPPPACDEAGAANGGLPAVACRALAKTYHASDGPIEAVRGLNLTVGKGEFFGLLGPNGAGKSTTIGMLTTRIVPTAGRAIVCGIDVAHDPVGVKRRIGVVTQKNTMDREVTLIENLEFRGRVFGMSSDQARSRGMELLERFGLAERAEAMDDDVSPGQSRRAMVCRALMHRPEVLFLDEPTAGVDAQTRYRLWDLLRELNADGQTIVLTTHHLEEAEALCRRLAVIDHGTVITAGSLSDITERDGAGSEAVFQVGSRPDDLADALRATGSASEVTVDGLVVSARTRSAAVLLRDTLAWADRQGIGIEHVTTRPPSLESAFLQLTGEEYRE